MVTPELEVAPTKSVVYCKLRKNRCIVVYTVEVTNGDTLKKGQVKTCKLVNGTPTECKNSKVIEGNIYMILGKEVTDIVGDYVVVIRYNGKHYVSEASTVHRS